MNNEISIAPFPDGKEYKLNLPRLTLSERFMDGLIPELKAALQKHVDYHNDKAARFNGKSLAAHEFNQQNLDMMAAATDLQYTVCGIVNKHLTVAKA